MPSIALIMRPRSILRYSAPMVGWGALLGALFVCCSLFSYVAASRASTTLTTGLLTANNTSFTEFVASPDIQAASVASFIDSARTTLTQDDFLAVSFDMQNDQDARVFDALTQNKADFQTWRENIARTEYHMELGDYEALFAKSRNSLLGLAESVQVIVTPHSTSYATALRAIDVAITAGERASPKGATSFVEARVGLASLRESAYLHEGRKTLHSLIVQDAIIYGVGSQIAKAFDWIVVKVRTYKCAWCKSIIAFMRRAACIAAGDAICVLMTTAMGGPLGLIASKFFCGFPLYLGRLFATWCTQGVQWLQQKMRATDDCLCSFTIPQMIVPATKFSVLKATIYSSPRHTIALGQICPTQAGQCTGSTKAQQSEYDAKKKIEDEKRAKASAAEVELVKKMTLQQKIAYHKKIIAGQIKTNMSEKLVFDLLESVTKLGTSAGKALLTGAKQLLKGDVKGAALAAGGQLAKDVAKMTAKEIGKKVAGKATQMVTTSAVDATTRVVVNKMAGVASRGTAAGAKAVGHAAAGTVNLVGAAVTSATASVAGVVGGSKAAEDVRQRGLAATAKTAGAVGKAVQTSMGVAGRILVDAGRNAAAHSARNALANTVGEQAGSAVAGGPVSKMPTQYVIPKAEQEARAERFRTEHSAMINATRQAEEAAKQTVMRDRQKAELARHVFL